MKSLKGNEMTKKEKKVSVHVMSGNTLKPNLDVERNFVLITERDKEIYAMLNAKNPDGSFKYKL